VIGCAASLIAIILVGWGEVHNWSVFLRLLYSGAHREEIETFDGRL
jgi:hypothetical protein